jgi:hypothetical protein
MSTNFIFNHRKKINTSIKEKKTTKISIVAAAPFRTRLQQGAGIADAGRRWTGGADPAQPRHTSRYNHRLFDPPGGCRRRRLLEVSLVAFTSSSFVSSTVNIAVAVLITSLE